MQQYTILFFDSVKVMLASMPEVDRAKVGVAMSAMKEGNFQAVETKPLRTPIKGDRLRRKIIQEDNVKLT